MVGDGGLEVPPSAVDVLTPEHGAHHPGGVSQQRRELVGDARQIVGVYERSHRLVPVGISGSTQDALKCRADVLHHPRLVGHDDDVGGVGNEGFEAAFGFPQLDLDGFASGAGAPEQPGDEESTEQAERGDAVYDGLVDQGPSDM